MAHHDGRYPGFDGAAEQTSLPDDMRAAIILRDVKGYSYDEIASILDANVGTIKSRISRGREKLREILSKQSELFGRTAVK